MCLFVCNEQSREGYNQDRWCQSHITTDGQSVCLGVEPNLGLLTRDFFSFKVTVLSFLGRPL
jgi:hypothetical protein